MDQPVYTFLRLGIVLGTAFPTSKDDPDILLQAIELVAGDDAFTAVEVPSVPDAAIRRRVVDVLRVSRLNVVYEARARLQHGGVSLSSPDAVVRQQSVESSKRAIDEAIEVGAERVNLVSGPDPGHAGRAAAGDALVDSLYELAAYTARMGGPVLALSTFPRNGAGGSFMGPTAEAVELARLVREVYPDFSLTLDTAHLVQLHEEPAAAFALAAPYLGQLHLANVVVDTGTVAPPFGVDGGVYDVPTIADTLLALFRVGFLGAGRRPLVCIRVMPQAGEQPSWVISGAKRTLTEAWTRL